MANANLFQITDFDGYTPQIGRFLCMLTYARHTTLEAVAGLSVSQLDYQHDSQSNSIGALMLHIASCELEYGLQALENRGFNSAEWEVWGAAAELGERGRREIRGHDLAYYVARLQEVREKTLADLRKRDDAWLAIEKPIWDGQLANNYFLWFHVLEDEINHRGQIAWLRKRLPLSGRALSS